MSTTVKPDFGWSWLWLYGHVLAAAFFLAIGVTLLVLGAPLGWAVAAGVGVLWGVVGFGLMRFSFRPAEEMTLGQEAFLPGGEGRVLDLGCGAGRTTIMVGRARLRAQITALDDFSAAYIRSHGPERFHSNMAIAGIADRVTLEKGDMRALPYGEASFDAVVSSYALDHLGPEIPKALAEARRVLVPGGQLLLGVILPNLWVSITWLAMVWLRFPTRAAWLRMFREAGLLLLEDRSDRSGAWFLLVRPP
jgi:SAM-dependent methyltransferase